MTTTLNLAQYDATLAKIAKINERAAKRGLAGRLSVVIDPEVAFTTRRVCDHDRQVPCDAFGEFGHHYEQVVDVEISGEAPKHDGWTFAARVDRIAGTDAYTLATAPGVDHVRREGIVLGNCDHCGTNRARKTTYIMVNDEAGEQVQVGSTCIKDFLGWEGTVAWLDAPAEIDDEWLGGSYHVDPLYDVATVVRLALASIRLRGFVSTQAYGERSTRDHVSLAFVVNRLTEREEQEKRALLAAAESESSEQVEAILAFLRSDDFAGQSSYVDNLKIIASLEYVGSRQMGLLVSAPQAYAKHLGNVREREAKKVSEWVGTVGQKVTVEVTLERLQTISTAYGTSLLVIGRTEAGEIVKTFTTAQWAWDVEEGQMVTLTATVKEHEDYNGTKQTNVTRAKKVG